MSTYPDVPGYKKRGTSSKAADEMRGPSPTLRQYAFNMLQTGEYTADEIAASMGCSPFAMRPRVSELHAEGVIEETGKRRMNTSGKEADVMRARLDFLPPRPKQPTRQQLLDRITALEEKVEQLQGQLVQQGSLFPKGGSH